MFFHKILHRELLYNQDIADADPKKSISAWKERLELENLETSEENIFIAAACDEKGIAFLKGESPLNVRKISDDDNQQDEEKETNKTEEKGTKKMADGNYTVVVDGKKFNVQVVEGEADIQVAPTTSTPAAAPTQAAPTSGAGTEVGASVNGNVWKILVDVGDKVEKGQVVSILEAMKMEIDIEAPCAGTVSAVVAKPNDAVEEGQTILVIS